MKRVFTPIFLSLLLLSAAVLPAGAQNVESLYERYAGKPGAESVSVGQFWINLAKLVVAFGQEETELSDDETDIALKTLDPLAYQRGAGGRPERLQREGAGAVRRGCGKM